MNDKPPVNTFVIKTHQLLDELKDLKGNFRANTDSIIARAAIIQKNLDETDLNSDLKRVERDAVEKMDKAILDYVASLDQEEESEEIEA